MGYLRYLYDADYDPTDASNPNGTYAPFEFFPVNGQMVMDFARRESVMAVPTLDSVLDGHGRNPGAMDRRDFPYTFRHHVADGNLDAEYDRLMAWLAPGDPLRLVYQTDQGALWYTVGHTPKVQHTRRAENYYYPRGEVDFTVTWRIRPYWTPRFSEASEVFRAGTTFAAGTHFGALGSHTVTSAPFAFSVDATGTAGNNLPTIPDYAPTITVNGPVGGSGGFSIVNGSLSVKDTTGASQSTTLTIPFQLPNSTYGVTIRLDRQSFLVNGAPFRPTKPTYQPWWWAVRNGVVNSCAIVPIGASPLTGGVVKIDWYRKKA